MEPLFGTPIYYGHNDAGILVFGISLPILLLGTLLEVLLVLFVERVLRNTPKDLAILDEGLFKKRTDFGKVYEHCLATLAEGYEAGSRDETFDGFIYRHIAHLHKYHSYPGAKIYHGDVIININREYAEANYQLRTLYTLFGSSRYIDIKDKALELLKSYRKNA